MNKYLGFDICVAASILGGCISGNWIPCSCLLLFGLIRELSK